MSPTKLPPAGNNRNIPGQGKFGYSDIPAGDEKIFNLDTIFKSFKHFGGLCNYRSAALYNMRIWSCLHNALHCK